MTFGPTGFKPAETTTKRVRPKAPHVNFMLQVKPYGVFVLDAEQFLRDGGSIEDSTWIPIYAPDSICAAMIGEQLVATFKGAKK